MKRLLAVAVVALAATSFAQGKVNVVQEADKVVVRKKTVIDFTDVAVEGELTKPEGSYQVSKGKARFKSLIKVREDFNIELQKSVDNL
jgi:opacity protein-like surface antigen